MTEQIEALPQTQSSTNTPVVVDRPAKRGPGRGRGRPSATDCKVSRKTPAHHPPREEMKKKKGSHSAFTKYFSARNKNLFFFSQCMFEFMLFEQAK